MNEDYLLNFGFAAVVAGWFMFRTEGIINKNTEALEKIALAVTSCPKRNS